VHELSYAETIAAEHKTALADALAASAIFKPGSALTLFPLLPVRVDASFESERFFLVHATDLLSCKLPYGVKQSDIDSDRFPPLMSWDGRKQPVASWLGVRAPLPLVSQKMAAAILGAIALTPLPRQRYLFSGRTMFGGQCTATDVWSISFGDEPHTPPMMHDIVLTGSDHGWLEMLAALFDASDKHSRKQLRALEYFYRAWFLDPTERFPALCMALDSLVGASARHTTEAVEYVKKSIHTPIDDVRLRLLMRVRGAVIHGAAPDVYDSEHYEKYYVDYETDPIHDLELITAKCLREAIFGVNLKCHPDPNAELLASLQAKGKMPERLDEGNIISETV